MRSNSQSGHMEWKKEQKRLASNAKVRRNEVAPRTKRQNINDYSNKPVYRRPAPVPIKKNEEKQLFSVTKQQPIYDSKDG